MFYIFVQQFTRKSGFNNHMNPFMKLIIEKCTWESTSLERRICLNLTTKDFESRHTPTQSPFKKTLSILLSDVTDIWSNFSMPQDTNLSKIVSIIFKLTRVVIAKFFTSPQFSPSVVDRKHNFPQYDGFLPWTITYISQY